jgi:hypothetical protein
MAKARKREFRGARAAADRLSRLDDEDRPPGFGERDRGSEPVRPGSDDDRV